ncbi:FadR/GntR family transcriptional regulator [Ruegeria sp. HKCCD8929]|uniref:FadR/GntR family transcriptional regulator n=1 Tax=Ruegeria sp. HKCCD8929 TaxID=2683006 RepID=UPI0020C3989B|nr:FCD domain-containing protein [Ruegeria sp. HKCCD8929]
MENSPSDADLTAALRAGIDSGAFLKNGKLLPERSLAETLEVTRARMRRILDLLEQDGTIFRRHGQGTFASPPPAVEANPFRALAAKVMPRDVMEVRLEIEPALAALAARRASVKELKTLEQLTQATLDASDTEAYGVADDIFHYKIAELAHNPLFLTVYDSIRAVRRQAEWTRRRETRYSPSTLVRLGEQHEQLFSSIAARDSQAAAEIMETHLLSVSNAMLRNRSYGSEDHLPPTEKRQ